MVLIGPSARRRLETSTIALVGSVALHVLLPSFADAQVGPLGTAADVHALSPELAAQAHPARLVGVVTYFDPRWRLCFVQDGSAGIFVQLPPGARPAAGDSVLVDGVTAPGDFAPVLAARRMVRRGRAPLPAPRRPSMPELLDGRYDSQWVEVEAVVRSVAQDTAHVDLQLAREGTRFQATLPLGQDAASLAGLTGGIVRVRAACGSIFNRDRQLVGIRLFVPDAGEVELVEPPPADPFAAPLKPASRLLGYRSSTSFTDRVRVLATVVLATDDGDLYVEDGTGGIHVRPLVGRTFTRGVELDVAGFVVRDDFGVMLDDAMVRETGRRAAVVPLPLDVADAMEGASAARLVVLDADLVECGRRAQGVCLVLRAQGRMFDADLPTLAIPPAAWTRGSRLRVVGVCLPETDENHRVRRFHLLVASPDDVTVLAAGPFWTSTRLALAISGLATVMLAVAAWVVSLRRRVKAQTQQIRARYESEAALARRYAELFDNASDAVYALDAAGRFTAVNPAGVRLIRRPREELIGSSFLDIVAPDHVPRVRETIARKYAGEEIPAYCIDVVRADGSRATVEVGSRVFDDGTGRTAIHGIARDVTLRCRAEAELEAARRAAEATSRAKSEFLAMMSHELRTPLNGVIGMNDVLLTTPLNRDQREMVLTIQDSANLLVAIISDVLDFAKAEAGKLRIESQPFDLHQTLGAAVDLYRARAAEKDIALTLDIEPEVPVQVSGDAGRIRQVVLNLVGNAIKFTVAGAVSVRVRRARAGEAGDWVRCEVTDTGPGIPPELRHRLFQPFEQADSSRSRPHGGSGLGLAICRQLLELMGGAIGTLDRDPGAGATFWFELPVHPCAAGPAPRPTPLAAAPATLPRRVLVVEDNPVNSKVALQQLALLGITADAAVDGHTALGMIARGDYDAVFMDCHMPDLDGYDTTRRIRALPLASQPYVIASTANAMQGDREICLAAGMDDYVAKPARTADLAAALARGAAALAARTDAVVTLR